MSKIAILYGGWSHESFLCAYPLVTASIKRLGYIAQEFRCDSPSFIQELTKFQPDAAFLASHGTYHEDGKLQGLLDWMNIPYNGSSVIASALGMNKVIFKKFLKGIGIATTPFFSIEKDHTYPDFSHANQILCSPTLIIKPVCSGASVGLKLITTAESYQSHINNLLIEFGSCIVEPFLEGCREFSIGVHDFDGTITALPVCELHTCGKLFDFEMKNGYFTVEKTIPAQIDAQLNHIIQQIAVQIHTEIGAQGCSRIDLLLSSTQQIYVLEINTLPGLMQHSVIPQSFESIGIDYDVMIKKMLRSASRSKRFEVAKQYGNYPKLSPAVVDDMNVTA